MATPIERMLAAYIKCALWCTPSYSDENGDATFEDDGYDTSDLSLNAWRAMRDDCAAFLQENAEAIGTAYERAGHDYWLTRNRHGAGFWDGDWPTEAAEQLTNAAHADGDVGLYVDNDGRIEQS